MTIRRLDVFFRTQITLDQPEFFNSVTNLALAPLQHLVGQNQFHTLKHKTDYAYQVSRTDPQTTTPPYFPTLSKVIVVVCAFFLAIVLTPVGIAARYMSFRSTQMEQVYSQAYLLQLMPWERTPEVLEPAFAFLGKLTGKACAELLSKFPEDLAFSFLSIPAYFVSTCVVLSQYPAPQRADILKKLSPQIQGMYLSLERHSVFAREYILKITEAEYTQLMPHLSAKLIEFYQAQKPEKDKKTSLDKCITIAIQSLESLEAGLKSKGTNDPWVTQYRNDHLYPFPFYLAQQIETHPKVVARTDKVLWERFMALRQSCLAFLPRDCDEKLLQNTKAQANATLKAPFKPNVEFFKTLREKLESGMETSEIKGWMDEQRRKYDYSYPFYTQPRILKSMCPNAVDENLPSSSEISFISLEKLKEKGVPGNRLPFFELFLTSLNLLRERGLEEYIDEKPHPLPVTVNALMQALDQLEIIAKLQELIKTQTA